jgi:hypothetical protein
VISTYVFLVGVLSVGVGPSVVAIFTDFMFKDEARLGASIAAMTVIFIGSAACVLVTAFRPMRDAVLHGIRSGQRDSRTSPHFLLQDPTI